MNIIREESPVSPVYTPDIPSPLPGVRVPDVPVNGYAAFIRPAADEAARRLGDACAREVTCSRFADFERSADWCCRNRESHPDRMVHVSTFLLLDGMVWMTYYANTSTADEDHTKQEARLAFCPLDAPQDLTVVRLQKVGDTLDGRTITHLYDTILLYKGGDELYLMWTAAPEDNYYRLYRTFNIRTRTLGPIRANRFRVGDITNDFSITGMQNALAANRIPFKSMWNDIGIMQKLSTRVENGETWYYTGAYSGNFNCIIKSRDLITWEYVSTPDFPNASLWENATYVIGDRCWYFVRQQECSQGFLTCFDLNSRTWETPVLITDAQSRSDFFMYKGELYLVHAPVDRRGFGIVRIDRENPAKSRPVLAADMHDSLFYPFVRVYDDDAWISYTVDRKHIRLSHFDLRHYLR